MLLAELCKGWLEVSPRSGGLEVRGLACDSRRVRHGDLFVAVDGPLADGHRFARQAVASGAVAVVGELRPADDRLAGLSVPYLRVRDSRAALGDLCDMFYGRPSSRLEVVGVTGTKGKTTTSWLLDGMLRACGRSSALVGTVENRIGTRVVASRNTTPGCLELHEWLREHAAGGGTHAVIEVSSHAIEQRRVAGLRFAGAVFTNIAPEHLDYHGTLERYLETKSRLFTSLAPTAFAVLSREDRASPRIARETRARVLWYGTGPEDGVADLRLTGDGATFRWRGAAFRSRLVGHHNALNAIGALAAASCLGLEPAELAAALEEASPPPGRLEAVSGDAPFRVVVDYAHTDGALEAVLRALRPLTPGRLITIFGCGGDRDPSKRPRMGRVAEAASDQLIITSDNPRTEPPDRIIEEIVSGLARPRDAVVVEDRREAIGLGIRMARRGDTVLIAGKGHETYQEAQGRTVHFDDREVAREYLGETLAGPVI